MAIDDDRVIDWTTKEVVKALRNAPDTVTLQLRSDPEIREKVRPYLSGKGDLEGLSRAITPVNLKGVTKIRAKTDAKEFQKREWLSNFGAAALSFDGKAPTTGKKCEAFLMTGDKILNLTPRSSLEPQLESSRSKKQKSAPDVEFVAEDEFVKENGVERTENATVDSSDGVFADSTELDQRAPARDDGDGQVSPPSPESSSFPPSSLNATSASSSSSATAGNADHQLLSESSTGDNDTPMPSLKQSDGATTPPSPRPSPTHATKTVLTEEHKIVLSVQGPSLDVDGLSESPSIARRPSMTPPTSSVSSTPPTSPHSASSTSMAAHDGSRIAGTRTRPSISEVSTRVPDAGYGELVADESPSLTSSPRSVTSSQSSLPPPFPVEVDEASVDASDSHSFGSPRIDRDRRRGSKGGDARSHVASPSKVAKNEPDSGKEAHASSGQGAALGDPDRSAAVRLARRLFELDGFQPRDVLPHLCKQNEFSKMVGDEYLRHFSFKGLCLEDGLRDFLKKVPLEGETQDRERVLSRFADRYFECNADRWSSPDAVHTLACAMMVLNTDLHSGTVEKKRQMTLDVFVDHLAGLNDGRDFHPDLLEDIYRSIKEHPFVFEANRSAEDSQDQTQLPRTMLSSSNPFFELPDPSKSTEYKKGYFYRKCVRDPGGNPTGLGKRGWRIWYGVIRDLVLLLFKDDETANGRVRGRRGSKGGKESHPEAVVHLHHAVAFVAKDYTKRENVFRLYTADQAEYLFLPGDVREMMSWVETINWVCAKLSAPALSGAVGSGPVGSRTNVAKRYTRPLLPSAVTRYALPEQSRYVANKLRELEEELYGEERAVSEPSRKWNRGEKAYALEKISHLRFEVSRYKTYDGLLRRKANLEDGSGGGDVNDAPYSYKATVYMDKALL